MEKIYNVLLDTKDDVKNPSFVVNTNDLKTVKINVLINQDGEPLDLTGATVRLAVKKPDKTTVLQDITVVDALAGSCAIVLNTQAYVIDGKYDAEVMVYYGVDTVAVTGKFSYKAVKGILDDETVESANEWQSINQAIADAEGILIDLRDNGTGVDAQARADITTLETSLADIASYVYVENFKKQGNETDDTPRINRAIDAAYQAGKGTVLFDPSKTYILKRRIPTSQAGAIQLKKGVSLIGNGAKLTLQSNCSFMEGYSWDGNNTTGQTSANITADVTYATTTLTVNSTTGFAVGDEVAFRLGDNPWDVNETKYTDVVKIVSLTATSITIDKPILTTMTVATTSSKNKVVVKIPEMIRDIEISGFELFNDISNGANSEMGIELRYCQNVKISNIKATNPGAGAIILAYCDGVKIENIRVPQSIKQGGQPSKGRILNFWNCRNIDVNTVHGRDFEGVFGFFESYNQSITLRNVLIENTNAIRNNATEAIFGVLQGSKVNFDNISVEGNGGFVLVEEGGTTDNEYKINNLTLKTNTRIKGGLVTANVTGKFIENIPGSSEVFNMDNTIENQIFVDLADNMYTDFFLPEGLCISQSIFLSNNIVTGDLEYLGVGRTSENGLDYTSLIPAGTEKTFYKGFGTDYSPESKFNEKFKFLIDTKLSGVGTGKFIIIKVKSVRSFSKKDSVSISDQDAKKQFGK